MAIRKTLYEILEFTSKLKTEEERIACLQANPTTKIILKFMLDPRIEFALPETDPPYKPMEADEPGRLFSELRRLYIFTKDGQPNMKPLRREMAFIELLESVNKDEAVLLLHMKNKKSPFKNINAKLVQKAWPDIF